MNEVFWMRRCLELAALGAGKVSPNPLVGAVLVHENKIIGEGYHEQWGKAHAERNCINSVKEQDRPKIAHSTLYCNLEPCAHHGKTPPCVDLILETGIPEVVISTIDPNPLTAGKSMEKLIRHGVRVTEGLLKEEGHWLNRSFFIWITQKRPYVILKWAQTADRFLGKKGQRIAISGPLSQRITHKWRSEVSAILVGAETAVVDNPRLDNRLYYGKNPIRMALDHHGRIPLTHYLLDDGLETWIWGKSRSDQKVFHQTHFKESPYPIYPAQILAELYAQQHASLLLEGGSNLLNQFLETGLWDEIRILESSAYLKAGILAPHLPSEANLKHQYRLGSDHIRIFARQ